MSTVQNAVLGKIYQSLLIRFTQFDGINGKKFIKHIFLPTEIFWKQ